MMTRRGKREAKHTSGLGKRLMSAFLATVMCVSMVQVGALAADPTDADKAEQATEQILGGANPKYYTWNSETETFGESTTTEAVVKNNDDASKTKVTVSKTIAPTGVENEFDITLQVTANEAIETSTASPDAAVVLVFDVSTSMNYCADCGQDDVDWDDSEHCGKCGDERDSNRHEGTGKGKHAYIACTGTQDRLAAAKDAAISFVRNYAGYKQNEDGSETYTAANAARWISIVAFADEAGGGHHGPGGDDDEGGIAAEVVLDWTNLNTSTQAGVDTNLNTVNGYINTVDNYTDRNGTNPDAGLKLAQQLLTTSGTGANGTEIANIGNKFLVLLTDGEPNGNTGDNISSYGFPSGYDQEYDNDYDNPARRANYIRGTLNTTFYSICFGAGDTVSDWMDGYSNKCVNADNSAELNLAFDEIIIRLMLAVDAWKVTDPMGQYMTLEGVKELNTHANNAITTTGNTLNWNLRADLASPATVIKDAEGNVVAAADYKPGMECTITYTLSYTVKLDVNSIINAAEAAAKEAGTDVDEAVKAALAEYYLTNGKTELDYYLTSTDEKGNVVYVDDNGTAIADGAEKLLSLYFKVPAVKGYATKLAFTKVGPKGEELTGAQFTLENAAATWSDAATSGADGNVAFTKWIPSGDTYTLTETAAPSGYDAVDPVEFKVSYGEYPSTFKLNGGELEDPIEITYTDVTITKVWQKPANESTPDSISVTLKQNGDTFLTKTITKAELDEGSTDTTWKYTFTNLPEIDAEGNAYTYTVEEDFMQGWNASYGEQDPLTITNTANGTTIVSVTKDWILPEGMETAPAVTVELLANGKPMSPARTTTLRYSASGDTYYFTELPKYDDNGQLYVYSVEEAQGAYQMANAIEYGTEGMINTAVITNTVADEKTTVSGAKYWNDDMTGRPESITVTLYADGEEAGTATATAETSWQYSFTDLPRYEFTRDDNNNITAVREIEYTVEETEVEGYTSVVDGYNITNTRTGVVDLTVNKVWIDTEDAEPSEIEIQLYANGQAFGDAVWMSDTHTFEELPKYDEYGLEITWSVQETVIPMGYTPSYGDKDDDTDASDGTLSTTITNTQDVIDDTLTVTVTKVWQQPSDVAAKTATFQLYKDGEAVENKILQITGNNIGTFSDLPKYKEVTDAETGETDLVEIEYSVVEDVPSGYKSVLSNEDNLIANSNGDMVYHFVNTIEGKTSVSVQKQWVKPATVETPNVTFTVKRAIGSGEAETVGTIVLENGESSGKLSGLDEYNEYGQRYTYSIVEESLSGYSAAITGGVQANGNYVYDVVNTINQANVALTVSKTWIDGGLDDSERPSVKLWVLQNGMDGGLYNGQPDVRWVEFSYEDGAVMATTQDGTSSEAVVSGNTWSYTFQLPKYSQDLTLEYTYSVAEYDVPAGYASVVNGTTATNTRVGTIDIPVTKYWVDPTGTDRPEITLILTGTDASARTIVMNDDANGVVTATLDGAALDVVSADNAWTVTVAGLPQYDSNGAEIIYTLSEQEVPGYTSDTVEGQAFAIRNTINQEYISVGAVKEWANMDVTGVYEPEYPASITVALYRNGVKVEDSEQTVTKDSDYAIADYTELPKYASDGSVFSYQVMELKADGGKVDNEGTISFGDNNDYTVTYNGETITNTFIVPAKYMWIVKTNYVHKNYDGTILLDWGTQTEVYTEIEPKTITVAPADYAVCPQDGLTYDLDTSKTNITSVDLENENQLYELVLNYILIEEEPPAPPTPPSSDTYLNVKKVWVGDDAETRPESIQVQLLRDGEAYGETKTLSDDNGWKTSWSGLSKSYDWSVEEVEVPEGYTSEVTGNGKNWTITNTLEGVEIPDEEPPMAEIPDEDIPMADIPETGDNMALWLLAAAVSGLGLVWMAICGKKREEA